MNAVDEADLDSVLDALGFDGTNQVDPYGPAGLATFVLDLENGYKVKHRWPFDLQKFQSGKERRISRNDAPQESYDGAAILLGDQPRNVRATLARYASQSGSAFLLGLPHEELSIVSVSGTTVTVSTTAQSDWTKEGQRVACVWLDTDDQTQFVEATIQAVTATELELDAAPNADSYAIMPLRPIFLEPQQSFARYPVEVEVWQLAARAAIFDFAPALATLALGPITTSPGFDDVFVTARSFSLNAPSFALLTYAGDPAGTYSGFPVPTFFFVPDTTTLGDLAAALASSPVVRLAGAYNPADTIEAGDAFGSTPLTGGSVAGTQGRGATLIEYDGDGTSRPVWDRELVVETTATDAIQAMTQIIDHGGIAYSLGTADEPDWGRAVSFVSEDWFDWQWLKLFFATTLGPQKAFWLPTWRDDLTPISYAPGDPGLYDILISTDDGSDFTAWWPEQREHIQLVMSTGEIEYAEITASADNGDGTRTISVTIAALTGTIEMISWLELCRFESEDFEFTFDEEGVKLETLARVVQQ